MNIELIIAGTEDKQKLSNLLQLYIYEFSEIENKDVKEDGRYGYRYFDNYWQEENRHPFLFKVDANLAGFVLVDEKDYLAEAEYPIGITEFFVLRKYRRKGVGEEIARRIFDRFPGKWSIREMAVNKDAQTFWRKVINKYTKGNFKEIVSENDKWIGPIQLFDNSAGL